MVMRGVSHSTVPPCYGQADCIGCLWRDECVRATLSRPPDRRYGPKRRSGRDTGREKRDADK